MAFTPKELQDFLDFDPENGKKGAPGENAKDGEDAPKMLDISQNEKHELIITLDDGEQFNVGKLPQGDKGDFIKGDPGESIKGDPGESTKGEPGDSIKGDPGEPGESIEGKPGKNAPVLVSASKTLLNDLILKFDNGDEINVGQLPAGKEGDPGDEGVGFVNAKIVDDNLIIERSDGETINVGRVKGERGESIHTTVHKGGTGPSTNPHKLLPVGTKGDLLVQNGNRWIKVGLPPTLNHYLVPNPLKDGGVAWQERGVSYLQDDTGAILQDEAGNALEGKDTIDALLLVNDKPTLLEVTFADSPVTLTRPDNGKLKVNVDCSGGLPIINLYPRVEFDLISIKKTDLSSNDKLTYKGDGDDTIDDLAERDISTQYTTDSLEGGRTQWERR